MPVDIIGVNEVGGGTSSTMYLGKPLSWIRDSATSVSGEPNPVSVKQAWAAAYRDTIILNPLNQEIGRYNLTTYDLTVPENKQTLKGMLLAAATPADTDNDKLPDYWEMWAYGSLSGNGGTTGADGYKRLLHYAHCSAAPGSGVAEGIPRLVYFEESSAAGLSISWTRRRGTAFGLTVTPEFSQSLASWVTEAHGYEDWSSRRLYDGSGGEVIEWRTTLPNPFRFTRLRVVLP